MSKQDFHNPKDKENLIKGNDKISLKDLKAQLITTITSKTKITL